MVQNKLHWDTNNAVRLPKPKNSYQSSPTFLCFESPTALFVSQYNLFRTMRPDPAKGLLVRMQTSPTLELINRRPHQLSPQRNLELII